MVPSKPEYFNSLEGIRAYAFLAVFFLHYHPGSYRPGGWATYPLFLAWNLGWFMVPIFFVLSGFLITRVLLNTREREGFFRVFYLRRAVRILPLYYFVIALVAAIAVIAHWRLQPQHLLYLTYLQNFTLVDLNSNISLNHLWSLAIEEQFYLLWPLAIWFLRSEKAILNFSYGLILASTLFRFSFHYLGIPMVQGYFSTPTRVDAIILGAVLAIHYKRGLHWDRFVQAARLGIPVLLGCLTVFTLLRGSSWPDGSASIALCIPAMNLIGLGFVILALTPNSAVARACSGHAICSFGKLTYSLYIFHFLYEPFFLHTVRPALAHHMPYLFASALSTLIALALTVALGLLSYKLIELPGLALKDRFKYGPRIERPASVPLFTRPSLVFGPAVD